MKFAISGKMRSGKDTITDYLFENYSVESYSFAHALKNCCGFAFNISSDDLFVKKPENVRKCLQLFGQAGRAYNPDIWVDICLDGMSKWTLKEGHVSILDLRLKNEANRLKKEGFILIRVNRDRDKRFEFGLSNEDDITETDLDDYEEFDYIVNNNDTKEELYYLIDKIMEEHNVVNTKNKGKSETILAETD